VSGHDAELCRNQNRTRPGRSELGYKKRTMEPIIESTGDMPEEAFRRAVERYCGWVIRDYFNQRTASEPDTAASPHFSQGIEGSLFLAERLAGMRVAGKVWTKFCAIGTMDKL
jgi:hypothetical protein